MSDLDNLITTDVDPHDIAELADEDLASAIAAEKKLMKGLTRLDARAWIDKKTRSLQQSMMALTAIRNTLAAVNNLPDEILVEIFWILALNVRPSLSAIGKMRPIAGISWLVVAKVCRRWRNIALWTPKLYSFIDARNLTITRIFLRRSNNLPIDIYMQSNASSTNVHGIMTEVKPHFLRVRELQFQARYQSMLALTLHVGSLSAPMLESLHLEQIAIRRILALNEAIIMPEVFNGQTPALRRLYLAHVSIPWTSPIYTGLTDLHLLLQHSSTSPSIDTFLHVLENCPLLENLTLIRAGPTLETDLLEYPEPIRLVELARLHEIYLHLSRPIDTQYVIAHLDIPSTASITICCQLDSDQDFSAVLPRDCNALKGLPHVRRLRFYVEDVQSITLTGYTQSSAKVLSMSLFVGESEGMLKPRLFFSQISRFFPVSHLEELQVVDCAAYLSKEKYAEVLSNLPSLTHLTASEKWPSQQRQILSALTVPSSRNGCIVCPSLKVLRFSGLDSKLEVIDSVANACRSRASKGAALDAVHVAGLSDEAILFLQQMDVVSAINVDDSWVEEMFILPSS